LLNFVKVIPKTLLVPFFSGHGVYTPCSGKRGTLDFGYNFCESRPIFEISSLTDSQGNSLCNHDGSLYITWTTLLHYHV